MILSAYIHIPFCTHKCEFCDFAAYAGLLHLAPDYCAIVCEEIKGRLGGLSERPVLESVFYGGGTPGLIEPALLAKIHSTLLSYVDLRDSAEINLETTPHSITPEKLRHWRDLGVNRLSIGVESLDDHELKAIGRDHSVADALTALFMATSAGMENINCDLMYGLPTQTLQTWQKTLDSLSNLAQEYSQIKHVSAYALNLAPHAPLLLDFPEESPAYPDDDSFVRIYETLVAGLSKCGFEQYEISNFARPNYRSRHNLNYWNNSEYVAFGVGAHRYLNGVRSANWKALRRYMGDPFGSETEEPIDPPTRLKEAIMLGFRMTDGIEERIFESQYGVNLREKFKDVIERLENDDWLESKDGRLRLTSRAVPVSNLVIGQFM
jgi:oxygen-independent coproporphyrinogen-3 oxidase